MFVVLLKFSSNKAQAGQFMEGHKAWIKRGFDDGVFLLAGNLQPSLGGGIGARDIAVRPSKPGERRPLCRGECRKRENS